MINYRLAVGKYRPAKTPYLVTFHAVFDNQDLQLNTVVPGEYQGEINVTFSEIFACVLNE